MRLKYCSVTTVCLKDCVDSCHYVNSFFSDRNNPTQPTTKPSEQELQQLFQEAQKEIIRRKEGRA